MPRLDQRLGFTRYEADEAYKKALDAFKKKDMDTAIDAITAAIEALPNNSEYYAARGFMFYEDGEREKAREDFESALKCYRYEMLAHYGLGMLAYREALTIEEPAAWDVALQHFLTAHRADPARGETLYYLALVSYYKRDYPNAVSYMLRAQQAFEAAGDRRAKSHAEKWVKEFTRMANKTRELLTAVQNPLELPE